jgi:hypothetical protein
VTPVEIYLETSTKRVFAAALEWPGWCRHAKTPEDAVNALIRYGPRYKRALRTAGRDLSPPKDASQVEIVHRVKGTATTKFGAPARDVPSDRRPLDPAETDRLVRILQAAWSAFDRSADAAIGLTLTKGPRGGGRELDAIVRHVQEADAAYVWQIGARFRPGGGEDLEQQMARLQAMAVEAFRARARGEQPTEGAKKKWLPRYYVRRAAWHALDHAWEIEDRSG